MHKIFRTGRSTTKKEVSKLRLKTLVGCFTKTNRVERYITKAEPKLKEAPIPRGRVDYSTMNLKSNIDLKWTSTEDMENDLRQWLEATFEAVGPGVVREVGTVLKDIGTAAIKDGNIGDDELPMDKMRFSNQ